MCIVMLCPIDIYTLLRRPAAPAAAHVVIMGARHAQRKGEILFIIGGEYVPVTIAEIYVCRQYGSTSYGDAYVYSIFA